MSERKASRGQQRKTDQGRSNQDGVLVVESKSLYSSVVLDLSDRNLTDLSIIDDIVGSRSSLSRYPWQIMLLNNNPISEIQSLHSCVYLEKLDLSNCNISVLPNKLLWQCLRHLRTLMLHNNRIDSIYDLQDLTVLPYLSILTLYGNPVEHHPAYRHMLVNRIASLVLLDFFVVSDEEFIEGSSFGPIFGAFSSNLEMVLPRYNQLSTAEQVQVYKFELQAVRERRRRYSPIIRLQSLFRGRLVRKAMKQYHLAAFCIQKAFRDYQFRKARQLQAAREGKEGKYGRDLSALGHIDTGEGYTGSLSARIPAAALRRDITASYRWFTSKSGTQAEPIFYRYPKLARISRTVHLVCLSEFSVSVFGQLVSRVEEELQSSASSQLHDHGYRLLSDPSFWDATPTIRRFKHRKAQARLPVQRIVMSTTAKRIAGRLHRRGCVPTRGYRRAINRLLVESTHFDCETRGIYAPCLQFRSPTDEFHQALVTAVHKYNRDQGYYDKQTQAGGLPDMCDALLIYPGSTIVTQAAACSIQAVYRSYRARRQLKPPLSVRVVRRRAAVALQRWARNNQLMRRFRQLSGVAKLCKDLMTQGRDGFSRLQGLLPSGTGKNGGDQWDQDEFFRGLTDVYLPRDALAGLHRVFDPSKDLTGRYDMGPGRNARELSQRRLRRSGRTLFEPETLSEFEVKGSRIKGNSTLVVRPRVSLLGADCHTRAQLIERYQRISAALGRVIARIGKEVQDTLACEGTPKVLSIRVTDEVGEATSQRQGAVDHTAGSDGVSPTGDTTQSNQDSESKTPTVSDGVTSSRAHVWRRDRLKWSGFPNGNGREVRSLLPAHRAHASADVTHGSSLRGEGKSTRQGVVGDSVDPLPVRARRKLIPSTDQVATGLVSSNVGTDVTSTQGGVSAQALGRMQIRWHGYSAHIDPAETAQMALRLAEQKKLQRPTIPAYHGMSQVDAAADPYSSGGQPDDHPVVVMLKEKILPEHLAVLRDLLFEIDAEFLVRMRPYPLPVWLLRYIVYGSGYTVAQRQQDSVEEDAVDEDAGNGWVGEAPDLPIKVLSNPADKQWLVNLDAAPQPIAATLPPVDARMATGSRQFGERFFAAQRTGYGVQASADEINQTVVVVRGAPRVQVAIPGVSPEGLEKAQEGQTVLSPRAARRRLTGGSEDGDSGPETAGAVSNVTVGKTRTALFFNQVPPKRPSPELQSHSLLTSFVIHKRATQLPVRAITEDNALGSAIGDDSTGFIAPLGMLQEAISTRNELAEEQKNPRHHRKSSSLRGSRRKKSMIASMSLSGRVGDNLVAPECVRMHFESHYALVERIAIFTLFSIKRRPEGSAHSKPTHLLTATRAVARDAAWTIPMSLLQLLGAHRSALMLRRMEHPLVIDTSSRASRIYRAIMFDAYFSMHRHRLHLRPLPVSRGGVETRAQMENNMYLAVPSALAWQAQQRKESQQQSQPQSSSSSSRWGELEQGAKRMAGVDRSAGLRAGVLASILPENSMQLGVQGVAPEDSKEAVADKPSVKDTDTAQQTPRDSAQDGVPMVAEAPVEYYAPPLDELKKEAAAVIRLRSQKVIAAKRLQQYHAEMGKRARVRELTEARQIARVQTVRNREMYLAQVRSAKENVLGPLREARARETLQKHQWIHKTKLQRQTFRQLRAMERKVLVADRQKQAHARKVAVEQAKIQAKEEHTRRLTARRLAAKRQEGKRQQIAESRYVSRLLLTQQNMVQRQVKQGVLDRLKKERLRENKDTVRKLRAHRNRARGRVVAKLQENFVRRRRQILAQKMDTQREMNLKDLQERMKMEVAAFQRLHDREITNMLPSINKLTGGDGAEARAGRFEPTEADRLALEGPDPAEGDPVIENWEHQLDAQMSALESLAAQVKFEYSKVVTRQAKALEAVQTSDTTLPEVASPHTHEEPRISARSRDLEAEMASLADGRYTHSSQEIHDMDQALARAHGQQY